VVKSSFAPIADQRTRVLILGSLPGEASLQRGEYYANPRNQFWRLIGEVIAQDFARRSYSERLELLKMHGIGLWDVVRSAERVGSLDADIRNHTANSLDEFAATLPALHAVAFNGAKAFAVGRTQFSQMGPVLIPLPSSSPAHAIAFERKADAWKQLSAFLAGSS
jgi:TDG/mug DNA glycosylase family protein